MTRQCVMSRRAKMDLAVVYEYTEDRWGVEQADRYVGGLIEAIERRAENPLDNTKKETGLADRLDLRTDHVRSFLYEKRHRCYFVFDEQKIWILAVLHGAQDKEQELGTLKRPS